MNKILKILLLVTTITLCSVGYAEDAKAEIKGMYVETSNKVDKSTPSDANQIKVKIAQEKAENLRRWTILDMMTIGILLVVAIFLNKLSGRFRIPSLLIFLCIGFMWRMLLDSAITPMDWTINEIAEEQAKSVISVVSNIAMCFILFSGGYSTSMKSVRKILGRGTILATVGVILTAGILGLIGWGLGILFGEGNWQRAFMIGAIVSSTDAAAVFAILRGRGISLKGNLRPLLEFESGSNDPIAAFLTTFMVSLLVTREIGMAPDKIFEKVIWLPWQLFFGVVIGALLGLFSQFLCHFKLESDEQYTVFGVAAVAVSYALSELLHASGFMAVYICGLVMGNLRFYMRGGLEKFHDAISWLMQVVLFISLGLMLDCETLLQPLVWVCDILVATGLMFIARPVAVFTCLIGSKYTFNEKLFVSWVGLRGAGPIVFAMIPLAYGLNHSQDIFAFVFILVAVTLIVQGISLMYVAEKLGVAEKSDNKETTPLSFDVTQHENSESRYSMYEFDVNHGNQLIGKQLKNAELPKNSLVLLIRRKNKFISPNGSTVIQEDDGLIIMGIEKVLQKQIAEKIFPGSGYEPLKTFGELLLASREFYYRQNGFIGKRIMYPLLNGIWKTKKSIGKIFKPLMQ